MADTTETNNAGEKRPRSPEAESSGAAEPPAKATRICSAARHDYEPDYDDLPDITTVGWEGVPMTKEGFEKALEDAKTDRREACVVAAVHGDPELIAWLENKMNCRLDERAMCAAAAAGKRKVIRLAYNWDGGYSAQNLVRWPVAATAAKHGKLKALKAAANLRWSNDHERAVIRAAVGAGQMEIIEWICGDIENVVKENVSYVRWRVTRVLEEAAAAGKNDILHWLYEVKKSALEETLFGTLNLGEGSQAVALAARGGHRETVDFLGEHGVFVGISAVCNAASCEHFELAEYLLKKTLAKVPDALDFADAEAMMERSAKRDAVVVWKWVVAHGWKLQNYWMYVAAKFDALDTLIWTMGKCDASVWEIWSAACRNGSMRIVDWMSKNWPYVANMTSLNFILASDDMDATARDKLCDWATKKWIAEGGPFLPLPLN